MKQRNGILGISSLIATLLVPTVVQAGLPVTRQTHDVIRIDDDGDTARAQKVFYGTTNEGVVELERFNRELGSDDALRTTVSRLNYQNPINPFCDGTSFNPYCDPVTGEQKVFPNQDTAKRWVASFFTPQTVFEIEADLAILMEEHEATRSFYQFVDTVEVRNRSNPNDIEERQVTYTIMLNKNQYPGQGIKQGLSISRSEYTTNLYIVYRNSNTSDLLDDRVSVDGAGELIVYEMTGNVPETGTLTEIERISNPDFNTRRLIEPSDDFFYETSGVKAVLEAAREYRDSFASDLVIVDYHNPVTVSLCPVDNNGNCLPNNQTTVEDPFFVPKLNVFTTDRTFFRNVCTGQGVEYTQYNHIQAEIEEFIERYTITPDTVIRDNMSDSQLLGLNRLAPYNFDRHGLIEEDFENSHNFSYDTDISFFDNRITDYLNKNASAPNNVFWPTCSGSASYENMNCYEANGLHHNHYRHDSYPIAPVRDISIVDVHYELRVMVEPPRTETDSEGNEVEIPAVYEWQTRNTCSTHSGTRIYDVDDFCDSSSNINCIGVTTQ